jgi:DNA-binding winged helix-turn-helix (wHTH) protein/TolB-like protein
VQISGRVRFGGCLLDSVRGEVIAADGSHTVLRAKTLALLNLLLEHAGQLLSQNEILDRLWPDVTVAPASVTQCISELRQALGAAGAEMLKTLPRRGYLLAAVPELEAADSQALVVPARVAMSFESPLDRLAAPHDVPTVAVLQPRWLGPDPEDPWLAEGIAHDITEILTRFREPVVISSNSSRLLDPANTAFSEAARKLCARYLVTSTIRAQGPKLRLSINLEDTESGARLWSDNVRLQRQELFDFQDEVASRIVHALVPQITAAELRCSLRRPPEQLGAYHLLLRARELMARLDRKSFDEAGKLLEYALGLDNAYGNLHGGYAGWLTLRILQGWSISRLSDEASAGTFFKAALRLDHQNSRALALFGHSYMIFDRDYGGGEQFLNQAISFAPNDAETLSWSVPTLAYVGRTKAAIANAQRVLELSPVDPYTFRYEHFLSLAYFMDNQFAASAHWGMNSYKRNPNYTSNLRVTIASLVAAGQTAEARILACSLISLQPNLRATEVGKLSSYRTEEKKNLYVQNLIAAGIPA